MIRSLRGVVAAAVLLSASVPIVLGLAASAASADAVITVTTTSDGGPGSLRQAFADADTNGVATTIVLVGGSDYALTDCATGGALTHSASNAVSIVGNGSTIHQTCLDERVITNVGTAGHLSVDGVTITGGNVGDLTGGGGIAATTAGLTITNSSIWGNAAGTGGGVFVTGGGSVAVTNSTISSNVATSDTGAGGVEAQGGATLVYATVVGNGVNVADEPANIRTGGDLVSFGSVVARPLGAIDCIVTGDTTSHGYNFSDDSTCGFDSATDTQDGGDPLLQPTAWGPGSAPMLAPITESPLVRAIPETACQSDGASGITTDQRGLPRPGDVVRGCDNVQEFCTIGAYERQFLAIAACPGPPRPPEPPRVPPRFTG